MGSLGFPHEGSRLIINYIHTTMSITSPIQPKQIYSEATSIVIDNMIFRFGPEDQYAFCAVTYVAASGTPITSVQVSFTSDDLATWGADDDALVAIVKTKLGLD